MFQFDLFWVSTVDLPSPQELAKPCKVAEVVFFFGWLLYQVHIKKSVLGRGLSIVTFDARHLSSGLFILVACAAKRVK